MTHEQFKDICLKEFPLIEGMVKKVKALDIDHVSCSVYADGTIHFDVYEKDCETSHMAYHHNRMEKPNEIQIVEFDKDSKPEWKPRCFYDHVIDNDPDATEDDLPFC